MYWFTIHLRDTISEFAKGKTKAIFLLITVNLLYMFVKLGLQCLTVTDSLEHVGRCCLVNLMREQVKSLSSIDISVVSLSDLKKGEAEKVLGRAAQLVVFDKKQLGICLCSMVKRKHPLGCKHVFGERP